MSHSKFIIISLALNLDFEFMEYSNLIYHLFAHPILKYPLYYFEIDLALVTNYYCNRYQGV